MRNKESTLPGLTVVNDDESKHSVFEKYTYRNVSLRSR